MQDKLEQRLASLRAEFEKGQSQLRQIESQAASLRETLLRISGAIMVLEELLSAPSAAPNPVIPNPIDAVLPTASLVSDGISGKEH